MQRQLAGYHARWDIVTHLISLKADGSAKSCLRDKRVIPLVCISKHRSHDNQLPLFKENS